MNLLAVSLLFVGYTLVYAAVADHGRFAAAPWAGVFLDAYDVKSQSAETQQK